MSDHAFAFTPHGTRAMLPAGAGLVLGIAAGLGSWVLALAVWLSGAGILWAALTLVLAPAVALVLALATAQVLSVANASLGTAPHLQGTTRIRARAAGRAAPQRIAHV